MEALAEALASFVPVAGSPTWVCLCPPSPGELPPAALAAAEQGLLRRIQGLPGLHVLASNELLRRYPEAAFHHRKADRLGDIPYTPDGFAAIGTAFFRTFRGCGGRLSNGSPSIATTPLARGLRRRRAPRGGGDAAAPDAPGVHGAAKGGRHDHLPVLEKSRRRRLAGFRRKPGHGIEARGFFGGADDWAAKEDNLRELARELNLAVESAIFVDDQPVECAGVRAGCPGALVVELPPDPEIWPRFLDQIWAFDHFALTREDRERTRMLRQKAEREKSRAGAATFREFIEGLGLEVVLAAPAADEIGRVAQLTQRTNQFNASGMQRSENEVRRWLEEPSARCVAIRVRDRFGDYGIAGAVLYFIRSDRLRVDTFLLSCRVLGRGVEHQVFADLGRRAKENGLEWVEVPFRRTDRNQPAADFLQSIGSDCREEESGEAVHRFSAAVLAGLRYAPEDRPAARALGPVPSLRKSSGGTGAPPRRPGPFAGEAKTPATPSAGAATVPVLKEPGTTAAPATPSAGGPTVPVLQEPGTTAATTAATQEPGTTAASVGPGAATAPVPSAGATLPRWVERMDATVAFASSPAW